MPYLTGAAPVPAEGRCCPTATLSARREPGGGARADADGDDQDARRSSGPSASGNCLVNSQQEAMILASIVEKETGKAVRAADGRRRLFQPPADRHEARCRPDRHLPDHQGQAARPADPPVGAERRQRLQHLSPGRACRSGRSPIRAAKASPPCSTRRRPRRIYFVADGTGGHVFADTLASSIRPMSQTWYAIRRARGEM